MRKVIFMLFLAVLALPFSVAFAQMDMTTPSVTVADQVVLHGSVRVDAVVSNGPGFVVIHIDNNGAPGPVAGYRAVNDGVSYNVDIDIDTTVATPVLYAMLHEDTGEVGVYEFGTVQGADGPVRVDGNVVTPAFNVAILDAADALLMNGMVTVRSVTMAEAGWVVIHADNMGAPGPVLGQALVEAGTTTNVMVEIDASGVAGTVFPMLHVDTGEIGVYEFGTVQGADGPVVINGVVATVAQSVVPSMRARDQIVLYGDGMDMMMNMTPMFRVDSVVSEGPGVVVIHVDNNGAPGPVAGWAFVDSGTTLNVMVALDQAVELTPVLWPMLHVDDGAVGTYEFDGSSGLDNPVAVDGSVVTFPVNVAPSMSYESQALTDGMLRINSALIDAQGWLVIHDGASGSPGPVLASYPLLAGLNRDIMIPVDAMAAGELVFPMLHYDTGELGAYEFGMVEGADGPVRFAGAVVVSPLEIMQ
ncbi:hypothetical protein FBR02_15645 [Anaerolineae bacterium CFX9]|nr:hypothetical protein [Anaerolineae bacterium CFX9]